jgi:hypothetical protein
VALVGLLSWMCAYSPQRNQNQINPEWSVGVAHSRCPDVVPFAKAVSGLLEGPEQGSLIGELYS